MDKKQLLKAFALLMVFVLYPILFVYSINLNEVSFIQTVPSIFICSFFSIIVFVCFRVLFKNILKRALASAPVIFILLNFERYYVAITDRNFKYIYFMSIILILYLLFLFFLFKIKSKKNLENLYTIIIAPISALLIYNLLVVFTGMGPKSTTQIQDNFQTITTTNTAKIPKDSLPDIYLIILDEMASYVTMNKTFDNLNLNSSFYKNEGFFFADSTIVRYADTHYSIPTLLNLNYFTGPVNQEIYYNYFHAKEKRTNSDEERKLEVLDYKIMLEKWGNSFLFKFLKEKGYHINTLESVSQYQPVKFASDTHISPRFIGRYDVSALSTFFGFDLFNPYTIEIIKNSLFNIPFSYYNDAFVTKHIFNYLKAPVTQMNVPQFTMAHLICPHSPFVYTAKGELKPIMSKFSADKNAYLEQYLYVVDELEQIVSNIKKETNNKAVIIIQSDHGPRPHMTDFTDFREAFHIFNTIYFPDQDYKELHNSIAQPNTFRIVLNKYFGEEFEMLEDH